MRVNAAPAPSSGLLRLAAWQICRPLGGNRQLTIPGRPALRSVAHLLIISLVLTVLPFPWPRDAAGPDLVEDVGGSDSVVILHDEPLLPQLEPSAAPAAPENRSGAESEERRRVGTYTVAAGDTLAKIARRFEVSVETLVWANDLADPDLVVAGAQLIIPPTDGVLHRVRPGDTVADLAHFYGSDLQKTFEVNALGPPYVILVGQRLLMPDGKMPLPSREPDAKPASPQSAPDVQTPREGNALAAIIELPPVARPPNATGHQASFILSAAEAARESQRATGVPASVTIAQAILESYWGTSRLSRENNNYFGIKAKERPGTAGVAWYDVWEVINGANVIQREPFRAYKTAADSFVDHGMFFHQNRRYASALAARDDPKQFARAINAAGYATDPSYAPKLIGLMDRFNLYAYDLK